MFKLSIVTVVYNDELGISKTIDSIVNVKNNLVQYIVIDGGSSDNTNEIIQKNINHVDVYISEKDNGIYDAMNKGLAYATGDSIIFMNSSDIFHPFFNLGKFIDEYDLANEIYIGYSIQRFKNRFYLRPSKSNIQQLIDYPAHQAIFVPKKIYKKFLYDTNFKIAADYYWIKKVMLDANYSIIPEVVSIFELGGKSTSKSFRDILLLNTEMKVKYPIFKSLMKYFLFNIIGRKLSFDILYAFKYSKLTSIN